jgi:hypothetical protein
MSFKRYVDGVVGQSPNDWSQNISFLRNNLKDNLKISGSDYEIDQSIQYLMCISELLELYFPKITIPMSSLTEVLGRMICSNENMTTKVIKYYYCCASSIAYQSFLPEKPEKAHFAFPFSAKLTRSLILRLKNRKLRSISFATALNYSRKSAVCVPQSFIEDERSEYLELISQKPIDQTYDVDILKSVLQKFKKSSFKDVMRETVSMLSNKSCSDSIGSQALKVLQEAPSVNFPQGTLVLDQSYNGACPSPFFSYSFVDTEELVGKPTFLPEPLKVRAITTIGSYEFVSGKPFQSAISKSMKSHESLLFGRDANAEDVFKMTVKSKKYWERQGYSADSLEFISGDFKGATNYISPNLSRLVDNMCFSEKLFQDFYVPKNSVDLHLVWKSMAIVLEYADQREGPKSVENTWYKINLAFMGLMINSKRYSWEKVSEVRARTWDNREILEKGDVVAVQTMGQMMGDIKSFPVLCIINLALWYDVCSNKHIYYRNNSSSITEKLSPPCLINGDDFLAYAPKEINDSWFVKCKQWNFIPSIGKTYRNKRIGVINSKAFHLSKSRKNDSYVSPLNVPYLNIAMKINSLGSPINANIDLVTEFFPSLMKRILFYNKSTINHLTLGGKLNLYLPTYMGGLGVKLRDNMLKKGLMKIPTMTNSQYIVAHHNYQKLHDGIELKRCDPQVHFVYKNIMRYRKKKVTHLTIINPKDKTIYRQRKVPGLVDIFLGGKDTGYEGIIPTYKVSRRSRLLARDNWLSRISTQQCSRNGYFIIEKMNWLSKHFDRLIKVCKNVSASGKRRLARLQRYSNIVRPLILENSSKAQVIMEDLSKIKKPKDKSFVREYVPEIWDKFEYKPTRVGPDVIDRFILDSNYLRVLDTGSLLL